MPRHGLGLIHVEARSVTSSFVQGGGVPGGHFVIHEPGKPVFIPPTKEFHSIPLRHSDVVVDIGAYVGTFAIYAARFPVKRVDAYEPTLRTYYVLCRTSLPNLKLFNAAVTAKEQDFVELFISAGIGVTNSIRLSGRKAFGEKVPAVSYTRATRDASIVKIDVEGAEYDYPIVQPTLRGIIIDFHPIPQFDWEGAARALITGFEAAGFESVVQPDFSNGWTRAGSWVRPLKTEGEFHPMMSGRVCCGCGKKIKARSKALCPTCWSQWQPRHRQGFEQGETR